VHINLYPPVNGTDSSADRQEPVLEVGRSVPVLKITSEHGIHSLHEVRPGVLGSGADLYLNEPLTDPSRGGRHDDVERPVAVLISIRAAVLREAWLQADKAPQDHCRCDLLDVATWRDDSSAGDVLDLAQPRFLAGEFR